VSPRIRKRVAGWLAIITFCCWPVSALTVAKDEPQFVLGLSWLALSFTCADIWLTTDVRVKQERKDEDGE
jgi:hypothetical protein